MSATRERTIADQSARELAPLLTADERALVSILATAELHQMDPVPLVRGYAEETQLLMVREFESNLAPKVHPLDAAAATPNLFPQPCRVALDSARASSSLRSFYRSWLAQTVDDRVNWVRHESTNAATIGRLVFRTFVCVWLLSFILLFVIPEHQKMYEEFGVDPNLTMKSFLWISDLATKIFPLFLIIVAFVLVGLLIFKRSVFRNYIRRWFPGRWRQVVLPKTILKRKLMAWDLLAFRGDKTKAGKQVIQWKEFVSSREAKVMEGATQLETRAWLLRNMANDRHEARKSRAGFAISLFSFLFQVVLAVIIILATFTMFTMLIDTMKSLS